MSWLVLPVPSPPSNVMKYPRDIPASIAVPGPLDEPPRHQGHQAHPPAQQKPQITQMKVVFLFDLDRVGSLSTSSCRPCVFPNAKALRRRDAKPAHPPLNAEARSRRGVYADFLCPARSRPSHDGRIPLCLESDMKTRFRFGFQTQRLALWERKPRHLSFSFNGRDEAISQQK